MCSAVQYSLYQFHLEMAMQFGADQSSEVQ